METSNRASLLTREFNQTDRCAYLELQRQIAEISDARHVHDLNYCLCRWRDAVLYADIEPHPEQLREEQERIIRQAVLKNRLSMANIHQSQK